MASVIAALMSPHNDEGERVSRWECHSLTMDELREFDMMPPLCERPGHGLRNRRAHVSHEPHP